MKQRLRPDNRLDLRALFGAEGLPTYQARGEELPAHQIAHRDILVLSRPADRWRRVFTEVGGVLRMYSGRARKGVTRSAELDGPAVEAGPGARCWGWLRG